MGRLVFADPVRKLGPVDKAAYSFCVLELLHRSLRRRDIFAKDGDRWGDPRAKLLSGDRWAAAQPKVLTALGLEAEPAGHLAEIASQLHAAYVQVAAGLPGNIAVQVEGGKLKLDKLGKAADPKLMPPFRQLVNNMLPTVDFPELLLEVAELTALPDAFTHIPGALTTMEDFAVSLCAVWLSEACNVGMTPVVKPDVPALTRGRLVQVDQGYFRAENISAGNGLFIEAQAKIDAARVWGGGLVASADGVRFTVPVKSLYPGTARSTFACAQGRHLAERHQRPGHGPGRGRGAGHPARLAVHPGRHPRPRRRPQAGDRHHRYRFLLRHSSACSRSAATSSPRASPTSPTRGCGGSTPPPTTGRSSPSPATPSGWTGCAPTGATCCVSPDR